MCNFVLNLVFQFYLISVGNKLSYEKQLAYSLAMCVIVLALIPFAVIFLPTFLGFIVTSILIVLQGFANSIFQSSVYGVSGFLPLKFIIGVSMGNGIAGLSMNILRYIIIAIFGTSTDKDTIIKGSIWFFGIATLALLVGCFLLPFLYKHPFFIVNFYRSGEVTDDEYEETLDKYSFDEEEKLPVSRRGSNETLVSKMILNSFFILLV